MTGWAGHLVIVPILLPLLAGALMLLFDGRSRNVKAAINLWAAVSSVAVAIALLRLAGSGGGPGIYLLGNWPAPFGIVLVSTGCPRSCCCWPASWRSPRWSSR